VSTAPDHDTQDLVLVVVDEESIRDALVGVLASDAIRSIGAAAAAEALGVLAQHEPSVVVVDDRLPDSSGIDLARMVKERDPEMPVLLLTGLASLVVGSVVSRSSGRTPLLGALRQLAIVIAAL
jgi:two-component system NtrC family sensor kinase